MDEFKVESPAFAEGELIPTRYACDGDDLSPPLRWQTPPDATSSYVLIVDDPDAPSGTFTHWLLFNLPASVQSLPEGGLAEMGVAGRNDFGNAAYGGPCPPRDHGEHRYRFKLYALDTPSLNLEEGAPRAEIEAAMDGHILARAQVMGRYERLLDPGAQQISPLHQG